MERDAFLDRVRQRVAMGAPHNIAHPLMPAGRVPVRYEQDLSDPVDAFLTNAKMGGSMAELAPDPGAFVSRFLDAVGAQNVTVSTDPEVHGVATGRADAPPAEADAGIVGAGLAIAATGTVVFDASRAGGRVASLLPPAICVLVRARNVLPDAGAFFGRLEEWFPAGLPSQFVFCSGPSKSGDIESELTTGVHGPGTVWVGVM